MRIAEYIIYVLLLIFFIFWQFVPTVFPNLKIEELISILIGLLVASNLNTNVKLNNIQAKLNEVSSTQIVQISDLNSSFQYALNKKKKINTLRIYAISTGMILPIIRSFSNLEITNCILLLKGFKGDDKLKNKLFITEIDQIIKRWYVLKEDGMIKDLKVIRYYDHPTEYNCIIDDDFLILGLYSTSKTDDSNVKVIDPILVTKDSVTGKAVIKQYIQRFDDFKQNLES